MLTASSFASSAGIMTGQARRFKWLSSKSARKPASPSKKASARSASLRGPQRRGGRHHRGHIRSVKAIRAVFVRVLWSGNSRAVSLLRKIRQDGVRLPTHPLTSRREPRSRRGVGPPWSEDVVALVDPTESSKIDPTTKRLHVVPLMLRGRRSATDRSGSPLSPVSGVMGSSRERGRYPGGSRHRHRRRCDGTRAPQVEHPQALALKRHSRNPAHPSC